MADDASHGDRHSRAGPLQKLRAGAVQNPTAPEKQPRVWTKKAGHVLSAASQKFSSLEARYLPPAAAVVGQIAASTKKKPTEKRALSHTDLTTLVRDNNDIRSEPNRSSAGERGLGKEKWTIFRTWARVDEEKRHVDVRVHGWICLQRSVGDLEIELSSAAESDLGFNRRQRLLLALIRQYALPRSWQAPSPSSKDLVRSLEHGLTRLSASDNGPDNERDKQMPLTEEPADIERDTDPKPPSESLTSSSGKHSNRLKLPRYTTQGTLDAESSKRMHENLLYRMRPFMSKGLSGRVMEIRIEEACVDSGQAAHLVSSSVTSDDEGYFYKRIMIPFRDTRPHFETVRIMIRPLSRIRSEIDLTRLHSASAADGLDETRKDRMSSTDTRNVHACAQSFTSLDMPTVPSHGIRVLSDIDDTVRQTFVKSGSRQIIRQLFLNDITADSAVPGVSEAYRKLSNAGCYFHYVSNSPWELYSSIDEFFRVTEIPLGSMSLRNYTGMSFLNGLWTNAADRKRKSVLEVLDSFTQSHFVLIGDSGEMDIELYSGIAVDRPKQILGIFIRDVTQLRTPKSSQSSTPREGIYLTPNEETRSARIVVSGAGTGSLKTASVRPPLSKEPSATLSDQGSSPPDSRRMTSNESTTSDEIANPFFTIGHVAEAGPETISTGNRHDRQGTSTHGLGNRFSFLHSVDKLDVLQKRIAKARKQIPEHIALHVWRTGFDLGEECMTLVQRHVRLAAQKVRG